MHFVLIMMDGVGVYFFLQNTPCVPTASCQSSPSPVQNNELSFSKTQKPIAKLLILLEMVKQILVKWVIFNSQNDDGYPFYHGTACCVVHFHTEL